MQYANSLPPVPRKQIGLTTKNLGERRFSSIQTFCVQNRIVFDLSRPDCSGAAESLSDTFLGAGWRDIPFQVRPFLIGM
jgi:hypothetical protein